MSYSMPVFIISVLFKLNCLLYSLMKMKESGKTDKEIVIKLN